MQYSTYFTAVCVMVAAILFTIILGRKNLNRRAAMEVLTALILAFFSLTCLGLSLLITDEKTRFFFHELKFIPLSFIAPVSLMTYCKFTGQKQFLPLRNKLLLCIVPLFTIIASQTNSLHHIFRTEMRTFVRDGVLYIDPVSGWGYWVFTVYSYVMYIAGICVLAKHYFKKPRIYRGQIGFMILTASLAISSGIAVAAGLIEDYGDIMLVSCGLTVIVQYITIVNYSQKRVINKTWNVIIDDADELVMIFDHNDRLVDSNRKAEKFLDLIPSGADYLTGRCGSIDGNILRFPEENEYYSVNERQLFDKKGKYTGRVLVIQDISALENATNELEYISTHDYLTGLPNRLAFRRALKTLKLGDYPAALICVNIIGTKLINNIFGNEYGDRVIIRLAKELEQLSGEKTLCARLGGDEMGIILKNASAAEAEAFLARLREALAHTDDWIEVNLEANYAVADNPALSAGQLFAGVAEAMRKSGGTYSRSISRGFLSSLETALLRLHDDAGERVRRITGLCIQVADALSLSAAEKEKLRLLCVMSDIGLLSVPLSVIKSKGDLTNEQWNEWKLHTVKGHNIALSIQELSAIALEIHSHHERYDGYGYPSRLKGGEIPLLSRIYAASEFYIDAPAESAPKLLQRRSGTQFDPRVVETILSFDA